MSALDEILDTLDANSEDIKVPARPTPTPVAPFGFCPTCGNIGVARENLIFGSDVCLTGHRYPSWAAKGQP